MRAPVSSDKNYFYQFGDFRLDMRQRVLFRDGKPVQLTPKVLDTLAYLVENHNRLIEKNELMDAVWAESFVEEGNLAHNIRVLRRTLGDDAQQPVFIETVSRRGYRFIAPVEKYVGGAEPKEEKERFSPPVEIAEPKHKTNGTAAPISEAPQMPTEPQEQLQTATPPAEPFGKVFVPERRFPVREIAAVFILLAVGGAVWWLANFVFSRQSAETGKSLSFDPASFKAEKLANAGRAGHAVISPDGKLVAYTSTVGTRKSLWIRQLATGSNVNIVPPVEEIYLGLKFSHDGAYLYFVRGDQKTPTKLYRVPVVGGVPVKITEDVQGWFAISPDDKRISFIRNRPEREDWSSLVIADANGKNERVLTWRRRPVQITAHDFSPDGQKIIAAAGHAHSGAKETELIEVATGDGKERAVSGHRWFHVRWLVWSPSKNQIILTGRERLAEQNQLWSVSPPDGEVRQMTKDSADYSVVSLSADARQMLVTQVNLDSNLSIAPADKPDDGRRLTSAFGGLAWLDNGKLVYSTHSIGNDTLWMINADGAQQEQLTFDESGNTHPTANDKYVVYVSDRAGVHQLRRVNTDGSNKLQLTSGTGEQAPEISPDGLWVYYHTVGTPKSDLWKVSIDGGEPVRLTDYSGKAPSVSPDGLRLAYFARESEKSDRWFLVVKSVEFGKFPDQRFEIAGGSLGAFKARWTPDSKAVTYISESSGLIANIWLQPLDGSIARKLTNFTTDQIFDFDWSPDGKWLATIRGAWNHEVVLLKTSQ